MVSPLNTLDRGYALVTTADEHEIVHNAAEIKVGDRVDVQLAKGGLRCKVENINKTKEITIKKLIP